MDENLNFNETATEVTVIDLEPTAKPSMTTGKAFALGALAVVGIDLTVKGVKKAIRWWKAKQAEKAEAEDYVDVDADK